MEYYWRPIGRVIVGGLLPFLLVFSAIVAVPLARYAFPVVLAAYILFHAVLGLGIWQESMLDLSEIDLHPGRWWPVLAGLDVTCVAVGSLVAVLFIAPHWLRAEAHGLQGWYVALGAGLEAVVYLALLGTSGWLALRKPAAEWTPVPAGPPGQPQRGRRLDPLDAIGPGPVPRAERPSRPPGDAMPAPPPRTRPGRREKTLVALGTAALIYLPVQASWLRFGVLGVSLAVIAALAGILLALRQLSQ